MCAKRRIRVGSSWKAAEPAVLAVVHESAEAARLVVVLCYETADPA
jgi:hypothetical protein